MSYFELSNFLKEYRLLLKDELNETLVINCLPNILKNVFKSFPKSWSLSAKCVRLWSLNCISSDINFALIKDDRKLLKKWMPLIRGINVYLNKHKGNKKNDILLFSYYNVNMNAGQFNEIEVGKIYRMNTFVETSSTSNNNSNTDTIIIFERERKCWNGNDISNYSAYPENKHVLFPPYTCFQVTKTVNQIGTKEIHIHVLDNLEVELFEKQGKLVTYLWPSPFNNNGANEVDDNRSEGGNEKKDEKGNESEHESEHESENEHLNQSEHENESDHENNQNRHNRKKYRIKTKNENKDRNKTKNKNESEDEAQYECENRYQSQNESESEIKDKSGNRNKKQAKNEVKNETKNGPENEAKNGPENGAKNGPENETKNETKNDENGENKNRKDKNEDKGENTNDNKIYKISKSKCECGNGSVKLNLELTVVCDICQQQTLQDAYYCVLCKNFDIKHNKCPTCIQLQEKNSQ